jgi:hypothetical protein
LHSAQIIAPQRVGRITPPRSCKWHGDCFGILPSGAREGEQAKPEAGNSNQRGDTVELLIVIGFIVSFGKAGW